MVRVGIAHSSSSLSLSQPSKTTTVEPVLPLYMVVTTADCSSPWTPLAAFPPPETHSFHSYSPVHCPSCFNFPPLSLPRLKPINSLTHFSEFSFHVAGLLSPQGIRMNRYQTPNSTASNSPVELCDILEVQGCTANAK